MKTLDLYITEALVKQHIAVDNRYVDLNLPSGTLWATCNLGADNPWEIGDYYAWGETVTKNEYSEYNYNFKNFKYSYINNIIKPNDDMLYVNTNGEFKLPSMKLFEELINNCDISDDTMENVDGVLFTSKINNKTLFMPFCGSFENERIKDTDNSIRLWTCELYTHNKAYEHHPLFFMCGKQLDNDKPNILWCGIYWGFNVRGVKV